MTKYKKFSLTGDLVVKLVFTLFSSMGMWAIAHQIPWCSHHMLWSNVIIMLLNGWQLHMLKFVETVFELLGIDYHNPLLKKR